MLLQCNKCLYLYLIKGSIGPNLCDVRYMTFLSYVIMLYAYNCLLSDNSLITTTYDNVLKIASHAYVCTCTKCITIM